MIKAILAIFIITMLSITPVTAQEAEVPDPITFDFAQAKCTVYETKLAPNGQTYNVPVLPEQGIDQGELFVCRTEYPLMDDRLATYGQISTGRDGKKSFEQSQQDKLTAAGRELNKSLMDIKSGRLWAILQAPVGYNSVSIVPYEQVPLSNPELQEAIRAAFEKAAKLAAAEE